MRCPECHTHSEDDAHACETCGLIFLAKPSIPQEPARRAEDLARNRRRVTDRSVILCRFCGGEIFSDVARCRHCSEIVNDDYYRERAQKVRARVNYASWVAYIFGLGALLVFRPVGLVSIAAGLLLSIAYYAIPVEPPRGPREKKNLGAFLKKQFKMERVQVPIPAMRNKKLVFVGTPLIAAMVGYSANLLLLQQPMNDVLKQNAAFHGMSVSAHYEYWVVPGVVVYDLQSLTLRQAPIDVHTALLEFAKKLRTKRYSRVDLSYRGIHKFSIDGASFQRLGDEYAKHNFDFVLYKAPQLFRTGSGKAVQGASDHDALVQFHRQWYGDDSIAQPLQNGALTR
jgi:hypothetical protein